MSVDAGGAVAHLELDRSKFTTGIKGAYQELNTFLRDTEGAGTRLNALGYSMSGVGSMLTKGVTVPLAGAGAMMTKFSMDYESSLAKVETIADTSVVSIGKLSDGILRLSNKTGIGANELNESLYNTISAGVDTANSLEFLTQATKLAKAGFADTGSTIDALTSVVNAYGLEATEVTRISDLLIESQNKGKLTVGELSSSIGKIIPSANAAGVSIDQLCTGYVELTKNGVAVAESTTYYNSMLNELSKTGSKSDEVLKELTGSGFKGLMEQGKSVADVLELLNEYAKANNLTLADMFGSAEAAKAGLILAKNAGADFNKTLLELENTAGATDKAFDIVSDTAQEKLTKALNKAKNAGIELGNNLLPLATEGIEKLSDLAENFNGLDESTQETIISLGLYGAAAGPVLSVTGKMVNGVGNLVTGLNKLSPAIGGLGLKGLATGLTGAAIPLAVVGAGFYAVHEASDVMKSSITKSTDEMSGMEKVMAKLMGVQRYSKNELIDMGLVYKDFSENISPEFKQRVEDNTKSLNEFALYLNEINFDGVISSEEINEFDNRVNNLVSTAIDTINSKKDESNKALKGLFADDGIINESEQLVLDYLSRSYDTQITETNKLKDEINGIKSKAIEEGRLLNNEEIKAVEEKLAKIKQLELESIGSNEEEMLYARNEFNARVASIDLKSAVELMKEKAAIRDEEKIQIEASYNTNIELMKSKLSEATGEERKALEEQIKEAEKTRDLKLNAQDDYFDEYLRILGEKNPEILARINKFNGEELKEIDIQSQKSLESMKSRYDGINQITEDGMYKIYDLTSGMWKNIQVEIDERTGEILGIYDTYSGAASGYTHEISLQMAQLASDYSNNSESIKKDLEKMSGASINSKNQVIGANGEVITSLKDVTKNVDGTKTAFANIDNKTYKINFSDNGAIKTLQAVVNNIDWINRNPASVVVKGGMTQMAYATGTENAMPGLATVAEYGPELIVGAGGRMELATQRSIMPMVGGETVYNARQTQEILSSMNRGELVNKVSFSDASINKAAELIVSAIRGLDVNIERAVRETGNNIYLEDSESMIDTDRLDIRGIIEEITDYERISKL